MDHRYVQTTHVAKTLRAGQHGTCRAQKRHGEALVCVRYRYDALNLYRLTTVELIIDHAPIHPHRFDIASFGLHIGKTETELHRAIKAEGGRWDRGDRMWWLKGSKVRKLGLIDRIIQK